MANKNNDSPKRRSPAKTPEARENYLIDLAMRLIETRLLAGTASSQETTHFLKMGSTKEKIEKEILERQKDLITAKTEAIQSQKVIEELYTQAISAMRSYSGSNEETPEDYND